MTFQGERKAEGYGYSIDSWPKQMQDAFLNEGHHREESECIGPKPVPEEVPFNGKTDATVTHMANFFDSVRTRRPGYETVEVGHRAAAAGHMVNLSYRSGKRMLWDPANNEAQPA